MYSSPSQVSVSDRLISDVDVFFFPAADLCFTTQLSAKTSHSQSIKRQINSPGLSPSPSLKHSYLDRETSLILRNIAGKPSHLLTKVTPYFPYCTPLALLSHGNTLLYLDARVNEHARRFTCIRSLLLFFPHLLLRTVEGGAVCVCVCVLCCVVCSAVTCPVWLQYAGV